MRVEIETRLREYRDLRAGVTLGEVLDARIAELEWIVSLIRAVAVTEEE